MTQILVSLGLGLSIFISTNLDDLIILLVLFADASFTAAQVVLGQYLGIGLLIGVCTILAVSARHVPAMWIGLTGILPLMIGLAKLCALRRRNHGVGEIASERRERKTFGRGRLRILTVALVVIANCGDNIGVWVPCFARGGVRNLPWFVIAFVVMTGLWCRIAYLCVSNEALGDRFRKYGHFVLPFALIALGAYVLSDAVPLLAWTGWQP